MDLQGGSKKFDVKNEKCSSAKSFLLRGSETNFKIFVLNPEGFYSLAAQSVSTGLAILVSAELVRKWTNLSHPRPASESALGRLLGV